MSANSKVYGDAGPVPGEERDSRGTVYRVVIQGTNSDVETLDSFAIKYGILTNTPVTRLKLMMRTLPKAVMETRSASKARGALALIEEAGGIGLIEEFSPEEELRTGMSEEVAKAAVAREGEVCPKCGFPLKKGDEFCQFCHTPMVERKGETIVRILKAGGGGNLLSPKRLIIYAVLVLLAILFDLIVR